MTAHDPPRRLADLRAGEAGVISSIDVDRDDAQLLEAMGLVVGAPVMLARQGEPCIVAVLAHCPARAASAPGEPVPAALTRSAGGGAGIGGAAASVAAPPSAPSAPGSCSCRIGLARGLARLITVAPTRPTHDEHAPVAAACAVPNTPPTAPAASVSPPTA